ncbi:MAG: Ig-like domain-containing protein, partial [Eubacteriales bacterium]
MEKIMKKGLTLVMLALALVVGLVSLGFALESSTPVLNLFTPADGAIINSTSTNISFTVSDPDLISDITGDYYIMVNGTAVNASLQFRGHWEVSYDTCTGAEYSNWIVDGLDQATISAAVSALKNGPLAVQVMAKDKLGNMFTANRNYTVDLVPVISGLEPANGSTISKVPVIKAMVADPNDPATDLASVTMLVDNNPVVYQTAYDVNGKLVISYTSDSLANDANHSVALKVTDNGGNTATANWTFFAYSVGQSAGFSNLTPADGAVVNSATPTIMANLSNSNGTYDTAKISLSIDGGPAVTPTVTGLSPEYRISYTPIAALKETSHTVTLSVYDNAAGNPVSTSWTFKVAIPPVVKNMSPSSSTTTGKPVIAAFISDNEQVDRGEMKVDGAPVAAKFEYVQSQ